MTGRVYLDWNATAPLRAEAREAMIAALQMAGNPSSVHAEGRAARAIVERARGQVAEAVGCQPTEVVFTSGATEAAAVLHAWPGPVLVDEGAHDAVVAHRRGGAGAAMLALGLASGETGLVQDLPTRDAAGWSWQGLPCAHLCLDVTQAVGRLPFAFGWSGADLAILSAHKFGGPKGVGALIVREGVEVPSLQAGGGQEMGRRSGTENVAGIAGMGAAIAAALADLAAGAWDRVAQLRNILEDVIAADSPETIFVGKAVSRLPNTSLMVTPGWKGETQVMAMDLAGFAVSAGSACSSGKVRESRALRALGLADPAAGLRVSLGPATTEPEVLRFAEAWLHKRKRLRERAA